MADLNDPVRLAELRGAVLRADADAILDACVVRAAKLARSPIAVVSLVVRHVQLLRAQPDPVITRLLQEHVPATYEVSPFQSGAFVGVRLQRR